MIREAQETDLEIIAKIHTDNRRKIYKGILSERYLQYITYDHTASRWKKYREKTNRKIFVTESEDGEVIGFSAIKYLISDKGLLDNLHIRYEFQGKGHGTRLIRYCAKYLMSKGISSMYINVVAGNKRAEYLYKKLGAEFECEFIDHFEFEDALSKRFVFRNLEALANG